MSESPMFLLLLERFPMDSWWGKQAYPDREKLVGLPCECIGAASMRSRRDRGGTRWTLIPPFPTLHLAAAHEGKPHRWGVPLPVCHPQLCLHPYHSECSLSSCALGVEQRAVFVFLQRPALFSLLSLFAYPGEELCLVSSIF